MKERISGKKMTADNPAVFTIYNYEYKTKLCGELIVRRFRKHSSAV